MATKQQHLDDIDKKIILELQEDARRQFKIVAYHCEYDDILHERTPYCGVLFSKLATM